MWRKATCYRSASIAALVVGSLWAFSQSASAATVSITVQAPANAPLADVATPVSSSGNFIQSVTGSIPNVRMSPYALNTDGLQDSGEYSVLGAANGAGPDGSAIYNINAPAAELLWGSPDPYNLVTLFSGPGGTGTDLGSFTGSDVAQPDFVTVLATFTDPSGNIGSMTLTNHTAAAFEFAGPNAVPLPPAIYLFGSVLGGAFWLARRKRSAVSTLGA